MDAIRPLGRTDTSDQSIVSYLRRQAAMNPDRLALASPGRTRLTYEQLWSQLKNTVETLNTFSIGRNDRVAVVLPNGPELAMAFVAVATAATAAPLNPAYRQSEFDFYLADLQAKALMIGSGMDSPARAAARALDIPIIELVTNSDSEAGIFTLAGEKSLPPASPGFAQENDVALALHTSGTTSLPKLVPLTHRNLCTSALNHQKALALSEQDLCLNVMPLFHVHGLISVVLASLLIGAGVVCTSGFDAAKFFEWVDRFQPTWFTAAPPFYQALLAYAATHPEVTAGIPMRFLRSAAAPMPPQLLEQLEQSFHRPVIESYGMTEAAAQITSTPLPPGRPKRGSVGIASGPEVAIMDDGCNLIRPGQIGEIVIRGASVMVSYENNPEANRFSFTQGWFRTGDQGTMDRDGYVFITGRIKEIVNRGGEKVSPREVDEAILSHPAVAEAATFATPHPKLGQDLATAVVLRANMPATETELRAFLLMQLSRHKVPSRVLIVDRIPKSPAGKVQRNRLAQELEAQLTNKFLPPRNALELALRNIWTEILGVQQIGIHDNFFTLGGDSLSAGRVVAHLEHALQMEIPLRALFDHPTIAEMAKFIAENAAGNAVK